jgi:hypothetical protein
MTAAQEQTMLDAMRTAADTMMGFAPGTAHGPSHDATGSMPATGMPTPGTTTTPGNGGMMDTPTVPAVPADPTTPVAPPTPSAPATGMMGSGPGTGTSMGMGR